MSARVLGVDASPTATGLALPDGETRTLKNRKTGGERLLWIEGQLVEALDAGLHLVVLEGYNYGLRKFGRVFEIGEVGGLVKLVAARVGVPLVTVSPQGRAKFGTGAGNAKKADVVEAWTKVAGREFGDDNQCDAHILREVGLHLLGEPSYQLRTGQLMALDVLRKEQGPAIAEGRERVKVPPAPAASACQVASNTAGLTCRKRESGGVRYERQGPHDTCGISMHTIKHALAGNGYSCEAIRAQDTPKAA